MLLTHLKYIFMKKNMGFFDQVVRGLIAISLIALNIKGIVTGGLAVAAVIIAVVFIVTSVFGYCPIYALFRISTLKINKTNSKGNHKKNDAIYMIK
jgi:hypothetical protein